MMSNPIFQQLQGGGMSFPQFMAQMRGKDPNAIINDMLASGKISQQQLNVVQQKAREMQGQLEQFRSMFGL